jgi:hypothetical protein
MDEHELLELLLCMHDFRACFRWYIREHDAEWEFGHVEVGKNLLRIHPLVREHIPVVKVIPARIKKTRDGVEWEYNRLSASAPPDLHWNSG